MPSFLFMISFLLHIVLLMIVYYLFQQIQLLKQDNTNEVVDLFETYLQEIKAENRRLEDELLPNKPLTEQKKVAEQMISDLTSEEEVASVSEKNKSILQTDKIDDVFETSLEAQILQLYHQGLEVDEIARKLNCGKTEADLIINLYEKRSHKA